MGCHNMEKMDNTSLKAAITKSLKKEFPNCTIYKDKQERPKLPAFFVRYIDVSQTGAGMDFYNQEYVAEVIYRPGESIKKNELSTHLDLIGGQVVDLLSLVSDEKVSSRSTKTDYEVVDGVLVVVANYHLRTRIIKETAPYMQTMIENEEVK